MGVPQFLSLFGSPELRDEKGQPVRFRTRKQLALLVYLALEARERGVPRDHLIELFWSDAPPEKGRHSLSQTLSVIRDKLGDDAVTSGRRPVHLLHPLPTDLDQLTDGFANGVDLENPLRDLEQSAGASFAHWVDSARERCRKAAREKLAEQLRVARSSGDLKLVHERAAQLYTVDPLSDVAVQGLAEKLLLENDAPGAIRLLKRHIERAKAELGCNPHPDVKLLLGRIERGAIRLAERDANKTSFESQIKAPLFLGREAEMSRLEKAWDEARSGKLKTVLVTGPPGIGKSSLVRHFATSVAARAWPVWEIACQEMGASIPYAAVSELILSLARDPAMSAAEPRWLAEASRVTPALLQIYPGVADPLPVPADAIRIRVAEALAQLMITVADGAPRLVVIDDVQHIDPASSDVLHIAQQRLKSTTTLLIGTRRVTGLADAESQSNIPLRHRWSQTIDLAPLEDDAATRMIRSLTADAGGVTDLVVEETLVLSDRNPYLIELLISDWLLNEDISLLAMKLKGGPWHSSWHPSHTMRLAFRSQGKGLSHQARMLQDILAVAGRTLSRSELGSLPTSDKALVDSAALELIGGGLARTDHGKIGLKNDFHREFLYYTMDPDSRQLHHSHLAEHCVERIQEEGFQAALEASHHFLKASMVEQAARLVSIGAQEAIAKGASQEVERLLTPVIAACGPETANQLKLLLAQSQSAQSRYAEALSTLDSWHCAGASGLDQALAAVVRAEALHYSRMLPKHHTREAISRAASLASGIGNHLLAMRMLQVSAEDAADAGDREAVTSVRHTATAYERELQGPEVPALASMTRGFCHLVSGNVVAARAELRRAVVLLESLNLELYLRRALTGLAITEEFLGRFPESIGILNRTVRLARMISDAAGESVALTNLGVIYDSQGHFDEAESSHRKAIASLRNQPNPRRLGTVFVNLAGTLTARGNFESAMRALVVARDHAESSQLWWLKRLVLVFEADCHIACGHPESAWPLVEEAEQISRPGGYGLAGSDYDRLLMLYVSSTRGKQALEELLATRRHSRPAHIRDVHMLEAVEDWTCRQHGITSRVGSRGFQSLHKLGLSGFLIFLQRLGITQGS